MRFDLVDLRLFVHVAEAASITQGAKRSNLSLPAASLRIRGMEQALGTRLLERKPRRGIAVTAAGETLVEHARLVLGQVAAMRGELGAHARGLKGTIRLLSNTAALSEFLPDVLADFLVAQPEIDIELDELPSPAITTAITEGRGDIGIVADQVDLRGLETFPFRVDRLVVVLAGKHPLARRRQLKLTELLAQDFVGLRRGSALQDHLGQHAARAGGRLRLRVRLGSLEAICRMVERGVGIAIIPEIAAQRFGRAMAIRSVRLDEAWALRHLTICVRRLDRLPLPARQLVAHLRQTA